MIVLKPHDLRRINAFISDEEHAAIEYREMGRIMVEAGFTEHARMYFNMADDEAGHADANRYIKENAPK